MSLTAGRRRATAFALGCLFAAACGEDDAPPELFPPTIRGVTYDDVRQVSAIHDDLSAREVAPPTICELGLETYFGGAGLYRVERMVAASQQWQLPLSSGSSFAAFVELVAVGVVTENAPEQVIVRVADVDRGTGAIVLAPFWMEPGDVSVIAFGAPLDRTAGLPGIDTFRVLERTAAGLSSTRFVDRYWYEVTADEFVAALNEVHLLAEPFAPADPEDGWTVSDADVCPPGTTSPAETPPLFDD